jgi:hypothetical protein
MCECVNVSIYIYIYVCVCGWVLTGLLHIAELAISLAKDDTMPDVCSFPVIAKVADFGESLPLYIPSLRRQAIVENPTWQAPGKCSFVSERVSDHVNGVQRSSRYIQVSHVLSYWRSLVVCVCVYM